MINCEGRRENCHGLLYGIISAFRTELTEKYIEYPRLEYSIWEVRNETSYT
jgi:hypothetical protein